MPLLAAIRSRCIVAALFVTAVLGPVCAYAQRDDESLDGIVARLRDEQAATVAALLRACDLVERDPTAAGRLSVDDALLLLGRANSAVAQSGNEVLRKSLPAFVDAIARFHERGVEVLALAALRDGGVNVFATNRLVAEPPARILTLIESPLAESEVLVGGLFYLQSIMPADSSDAQELDAATEARAVTAVARLLRHPSARVRMRAVWASQRPAFTDPPHLAALLALLESDPDTGVRAAILGILRQCASGDRVDLATVVEALSHSDTDLQCSALAFLWHQDLRRLESEVPHLPGLLLRMLWDDNGYVVADALDLLRRIYRRADSRYLSALRHLLHHPAFFIRHRAATALGDLGRAAISAVGDLAIRVRIDSDEHVRSICVIAMRGIDLEGALRLYPSVSHRLSPAYAFALHAAEVHSIVEGISAEDLEVRLGAIRLVMHLWESRDDFDAQIARCAPMVDELIRSERSPDARAALEELAKVLHGSKRE